MNKDIEKKFDEVEKKIDEESAKKIDEFYESKNKEAEDILKDVGKAEEFLQKIEKKLQGVPVAGKVLAYIPLMASFVRAYAKKEYKDVPVASMVAIVIALIYFLSPIDAIPDFIPGVGYIDDALIIGGCIFLISTDLEDYKKWRRQNGLEVEDFPDYEDIKKKAKENGEILNAFFRGRESAKKNNDK